MAPESPGLHFTLARAYQRAGRLEDAARERAEFTRLDRLARTQKSGAQSWGENDGTAPTDLHRGPDGDGDPWRFGVSRAGATTGRYGSPGRPRILVDVVVRDRKGQPVRDLTAADFEVLEDGVTQKVGSFTPFLSNAPAAAAEPATGAPAGATVAITQCRWRFRQRTYRHRARFRSIVTRSAAPRGAGRTGLSRKQGRDCQLYRNLRR